jgi:hypothetical protein
MLVSTPAALSCPAGTISCGDAVAMSGGTAAVATTSTGAGNGSVSVYVDSGGTWSLQQVLTQPVANALYAFQVAISGDWLFVSAVAAGNHDNGSVYVYERSAGVWSQAQVLTVAESHGLGQAVAVAGKTAVIGQSNGPVTVWTLNGVGAWQRRATLNDPGSNPGTDSFGFSVAVAKTPSGQVIAVGAPGGGTSAGGIVYVYTGSGATWTAVTGFPQPTVSAGADYGFLVGVSGGTIAAEAAYESAGTIYLYSGSGSTWTRQQVLANPNGATGITEGFAIEGSTLAVGTPSYNHDQGAVYLYKQSAGTWSQAKLIKDPLRTQDDTFGGALAQVGRTTIVGAPHDTGGTGTGAAYAFTP